MISDKLVFTVNNAVGVGETQFSWQNRRGGYLAFVGSSHSVSIYNRSGEVVETIKISGSHLCTGLAWDSEGDILSVMIDKSSQLILWDSNAEKVNHIDCGLRDPLSFIAWAKTGPLLAIGTSKGNLIIYNHRTAKRLSVLGKHSKKISCGAWSRENLIALASEDRTLSISGPDGETQRVLALRNDPSQICFSEMKGDERLSGENTVSVLVGKKMLLLYSLHNPDNPIELVFQQKYGTVVKYEWFGDGYILLGFSAGYFVVISTHLKEIGHELFQIKNHRDILSDIALSEQLGVVGSCGDNIVKCHEMRNLHEAPAVVTIGSGGEDIVEGEEGDELASKRKLGRMGRSRKEEVKVGRMSWSTDGQLLAVVTGSQNSSSLLVYLSSLPFVYGTCNTDDGQLALLTNIRQVTIFGSTKDTVPETITIDVEPSFLAISSLHLAAGMNNRAWFYVLAEEIKDFSVTQGQQEINSTAIGTQEYMGNVQSLKLGGKYASALLQSGKIQLHVIPGTSVKDEAREMKIFPSHSSSPYVIRCHCITPQSLIYGTDNGAVYYFSLEDWAEADDYQHGVGLKEIYSDPIGVYLALVDDKNEGHIYNPVISETTKIPDFPLTASVIMWENYLPNKNIFAVFDGEKVLTYIYLYNTVEGNIVEKAGETQIENGHLPLLLFNGEITSHTKGGNVARSILSTHDIKDINGLDHQDLIIVLQENLKKHLALNKLEDAYDVCLSLNSQEMWNELAVASLKGLNIDMAVTVYRQMGNVGMVWALESFQGTEDKCLLAGHVCVCLKSFSKAQEWFLQSSDPLAALEMRRDLLQWEQALQLAKKLAPEQVPYISREYAQQLEIMGCYSEALSLYEQSAQDGKMNPELKATSEEDENHYQQCIGGIARCSIRCGDIRKGVSLASETNSPPQLRRDCAEILEGLKQYPDAAVLYETGEYYEKAASLYIKLKNWKKVGALLPNISRSKIHIQYAKAKEAEKQYKDACLAYETAKDYENVIRISLDYLSDPDTAIQKVKMTNSTEGAKMVARFFQKLNDYGSAIQFLVMSGKLDEAFKMAKAHDRMELYAQLLDGAKSIVGDQSPGVEDYHNVALHFENQKSSLLAGKYYFKAKDYAKAFKHLLRVARSNSESEGEALALATELVAESKDEQLASQLIDFLLGEPDGIPKDPKYVFQLYMARKQYSEAAKTAVIIANEEQNAGNYRHAHDVLFSMFRELRNNGLRVPSEMQDGLTLLHSYALVRLHVKRGDHLKGARMLLRVARSISKFPAHVVPILTSTVIECHRAGLRSSAFKYAAVLVKPEYRSQIDPKYQKKIEGLVRKPSFLRQNRGDGDGTEISGDVPEPLSPCPFCSFQLPETELNCLQCKALIPFCIATGRHIVKDDFTVCPHCEFPGLYSELIEILKEEGACPMCGETLNTSDVEVIKDFAGYYSKLKEQ
ncbi:WD repeat-containing protein 19 [Ischnura elegans]|uniref:WD repeat-containing protein 19 n=1 Tax=Ischnura elegans TaxID=197161 RepID=UPI001ED88DCE|nr:WD repeat-containing protein 19 [Ischnura elegans]